MILVLRLLSVLRGREINMMDSSFLNLLPSPRLRIQTGNSRIAGCISKQGDLFQYLTFSVQVYFWPSLPLSLSSVCYPFFFLSSISEVCYAQCVKSRTLGDNVVLWGWVFRHLPGTFPLFLTSVFWLASRKILYCLSSYVGMKKIKFHIEF